MTFCTGNLQWRYAFVSYQAGIDTILYQQSLDRINMALSTCNVQWCPTIITYGLVHIHTVQCEQHFDNVRMTI